MRTANIKKDMALQTEASGSGGRGSETNPGRRFRAATHDSRPLLFIALVLVSLVAAAIHGLRANGIFSCQSAAPDSGRYLAYCQATGFGDYDHGAFWFGLEKDAIAAASRARVLFIGNSRMQFGLSSQHLDDWFSAHSISYYLLGFSHMENHGFAQPLLARMDPEADAFIVNVDLFFEGRMTRPAADVMNSPDSLNRYLAKRRWQRIHNLLCGAAGFLCRNEVAFYRSRSTGAWLRRGGNFHGMGTDVTYENSVDHEMLAKYEAVGSEFLDGLGAEKRCIVLTVTPQSGTSLGTARRLAAALELPLVAPVVDQLRTFDDSHLDVDSAERWSAAFVEALSPVLRDCLGDLDP